MKPIKRAAICPQWATETSQAAQSINQAGQAARTTSGALNETRNAAQNMGQTMNTAGQAAYNNITRLPKELRSISRHLGEMDAQTKATFASFSQIYMDQRTKMQGFNRDLLQNKMNWISLGVEAKNYQGTTAQFMDQVRRLGAEEKKINDARIKANELRQNCHFATSRDHDEFKHPSHKNKPNLYGNAQSFIKCKPSGPKCSE